MRWSMLPVSVAIHAAALVVFLIVPLAADLDLPVPWARGPQHYVAASAAPAPVPVDTPRTPLRPSAAAPISAPDHIITEDVDPSGSAPSTEGGLPSAGLPTAGVPDIGGIGAVAPPPAPPPPPPVERPAIVRVGGTIREPRKLVDVQAVYPEIALRARVEGRVTVEATIDEHGFVTDARILQSQPLLDAAALAAVKQWRYTPTLLNGVPVRVLMTITFNFTLADRLP